MASPFSRAHSFTAVWEGGLSDHPSDNGGITKYGASYEFVKDIASTPAGRGFLQAIGLSIPVTKNVIRNLTREQAQAMFKRQFWDSLKLDLLPERQALLIYDAAVNCGCRQAVKLSQRGFNSCAPGAVSLDVDGLMGPKTRAALQADTDCVTQAILQARRNFYQSLAVAKPSQKVFLRGWLNRVNALEKRLSELARACHG